jgi:hypothetical protein
MGLSFSYPTLFVYRKGGKRSEYEGEQSVEGIVATMQEYLSSPSREIRFPSDYKSLFHRNDQSALIGLFSNENDPLYQTFLNVAFNKRKMFQFAHSFQPINALNDVQASTIVMQHHPDVRSKFEKEKIIFDKVRQWQLSMN